MNRWTARRRRTRDRSARATRDAGMSLVEIVVSCLLLGTSGVSMLSALTATVSATKFERDHARAQVWLQSAIEELQAAERQGCDQGEATIRAAYLDAIRDKVVNPPGWSDNQVDIVMPIKAWDGEHYWDPYDPASPGQCFDNHGFRLQLITIVVRSPDGEVIEQVSVVKG